MKPVCRNCHFLTKELREENTGRVVSFSLNQQERDKAARTPQDMMPAYYSLNCHMGVWDEGLSGAGVDRSTIVSLESRASTCFFFPYHPAMLFDAARELQKRTSEYENLKRSNLYTRIGLWVAAGALAVNALVAY
jgi:hypothetical protein